MSGESPLVCQAVEHLGPSAKPALQDLIDLMPQVTPEAQEAIMSAMIEMGNCEAGGTRCSIPGSTGSCGSLRSGK